MNEKRRAKRKYVDGVVEVINTMTGAPLGRVGNLSASGIMLITNQAIPEDALFQVSFQVPSKRGRAIGFEIGLEEQWSEAASAPGYHWAGFRIIDISPQQFDALKAWISEDNP